MKQKKEVKNKLLQTVLILTVITIISLCVVPSVHAEQDVVFSINQTDYYFTTGENALINLQSNNPFQQTINGLLSYTITQNINQGNMQYSSSNTQSTSFSIQKGNTTIPISFGTSNKPLVLNVNLKFTYTVNQTKTIQLNNINIHFVENASNKHNQQQQQQQQTSTSQKSNQQQQQQSPNDQLQKMIDQLKNNQQPQQQQTQQKLQNNQLSQDSSALKKQIQNQLDEQKQLKDQFKKQLAKNKEFQQKHQKLRDQGYNMTDAQFNPTTNNTGDFNIKYQKPNGEQATMQGSMKNGQMQNLQTETSKDKQNLLNQIQNSTEFKKFQKELVKHNYTQQKTEFSHQQNSTTVKMNYINEQNETATITANFENKTINDITLDMKKEKKNMNLWVIIIIILLGIGVYIAYTKFIQKKKTKEETTSIIKKPKKTYNYLLESKKLLEESKKEFTEKKYKDAYSKANQALRIFLSYENKLNKKTTNDEIISFLKKEKKTYKEVKDCFDLCSLVEFAKYTANKKDFDTIYNTAKKIIEKKELKK